MLKFFLIYLVVVFFLGVFRMLRAVRRAQKTFRSAAQSAGVKKTHNSGNVVEAEYQVLNENQ